MNNKNIFYLVIALVIVILVGVCWNGLVGHNDTQNWQIVQGINGGLEARDKAGFFPKWFATTTIYPRQFMTVYNDKSDEGRLADERIPVTFNDGGKAKVCTTMRISSPVTQDLRIKFHRDFAGNMANIRIACRGHLVNCLKAAAPLMSASEHQSARKAELRSIVEDMLGKGIYKMRKVEKTLKDRTDEHGNPITVFATEIVEDENGNPIIDQPSPLILYGMNVLQFSIEDTTYDNETEAQFVAKKKSFLAAEKSKAEREQEVQQRLMVIEKGLRQKAEVEAEANKVKAKAVIEAQQKVELAMAEKREFETKANKELEVAKINKAQAETRANQDLEVAKIQAMAAAKKAEAIVELAQAEEKRIKLAGAITEKARVLAEILAKRDVGVAKELANIKTPNVMIAGAGGEGSGSGGILGNLISLRMMQATGILPDNTLDSRKVLTSTPITK
jgi:hypothetical protein